MIKIKKKSVAARFRFCFVVLIIMLFNHNTLMPISRGCTDIYIKHLRKLVLNVLIYTDGFSFSRLKHLRLAL